MKIQLTRLHTEFNSNKKFLPVFKISRRLRDIFNKRSEVRRDRDLTLHLYNRSASDPDMKNKTKQRRGGGDSPPDTNTDLVHIFHQQWNLGSKKRKLLQINVSHHSPQQTPPVSTHFTPGEGRDTDSHTKGASLFPSLFLHQHPHFSLSLTHTLSLFSSHLKRLPKDRSKKMNRSQPVSWQQCAAAHKH